ncbi:hypothetical protein [Halothiobacillus sp. DCM-1]|uniref:hypothetical protein n=1 Tax=Halothiobacillus sp. DCM-1 TaxID=3112558 RepID=UPI00324415A2
MSRPPRVRIAPDVFQSVKATVMYEFTFLTSDRGNDFIGRLKALGIPAVAKPDPINESVTNVGIPDDIDDALLDQIEAWYEEETQRNEAAERALESAEDTVSAGIWVQLEDGGSSLARVDPALLGKVLSVITPDELGQLVAAIADAVEHPDITPICHNPRKGACG